MWSVLFGNTDVFNVSVKGRVWGTTTSILVTNTKHPYGESQALNVLRSEPDSLHRGVLGISNIINFNCFLSHHIKHADLEVVMPQSVG